MTSLQTAESQNPYLEGFLAPVRAEVTATDLEVTGHIPRAPGRALSAQRTQPGRRGRPGHLPLVHRRRHGARGSAARRRRPAGTATAGCAARPYAPPSASRGPTGSTRGPACSSVGANTNVLTHAGKTLALIEAGVANYELTDELDTVGTCDFDGTLPGGYTAHPHRDPATGELHAVSYSFARGRTVQYSVIDTNGHARRTVDIEVSGSPMMHDFSLTDKYVVIYDLPVTFDPVQVMPASVPRWLQLPARLVMQSVVGRVRIPSPIAAMANRDTGVARPASRTPGTTTIRRASASCPARAPTRMCAGSTSSRATSTTRSTPTRKSVTGPEEVLVLDVVRYSRMFDRDRRGPGESLPSLDRWTINLATGAVSTECRDDRSQEFPRINENLTGVRHRFGYTVGIDGGFAAAAEMSTSLYKHDYATGSTTRRRTRPRPAAGRGVLRAEPLDRSGRP